MWSTSVLRLGEGNNGSAADTAESNAERVHFLTIMMRQHPDEVRGSLEANSVCLLSLRLPRLSASLYSKSSSFG